MQRITSFILGCPRLVWMVFFRPLSFWVEVNQLDRRQRWSVIAQGLVVTSVTPFVLTLLTGVMLESAGVQFGWVRGLRVVGIAVMVGLVFGSVWLLNDIREFGSAVSNTFGVVSSIASGVAVGAVGGFASGVTVGIMGGSQGSLLYTLASIFSFCSLLIFIPFSSTIITAGSINRGADFWHCRKLAAAMAIFRWYPILLFDSATTLWALLEVKLKPQQAARFLRHSLAYWDEVPTLIQPFLARLLIAVGEQDRIAAHEGITHLANNTFHAIEAGTALIELESRELLRCRTIEEIAKLGPATRWSFSGVCRKPMQDVAEAFARCEKINLEVAAALSAKSPRQKIASFNRALKQLENLYTFTAINVRQDHSEIFTKIERQWRNAIEAEIARLQQTESIPNPYFFPLPLGPDINIDANIFVGRKKAFSFVEEHFLLPNQNVPLVLYGQPRIGKSSILRYFSRYLEPNLIPVYIDLLSLAQVESTGGLLYNLAKAIGQEMANREIRLNVPSLSEYIREPFIVFSEFLDEVERAAGAPENRLIVVLDEFEQIEKQLTTGKLDADLMPFLRGMMQNRRGIRLLFAGTHMLDEMIRDEWAHYFSSAVPFHVSYLTDDEACELITKPVEEFPLKYDAEAVDLIVEMTHCHPCLIQATCSALVDLKNSQRSRQASVADVKQALNTALRTCDYVFRSVWDWIPSHERELLGLLAATEPLGAEQLAHRLAAPMAEVRGMIERLTEAEVLMCEGGRRAYRFQVPLFRQWVERHAALTGMEFDQRQMAIR